MNMDVKMKCLGFLELIYCRVPLMTMVSSVGTHGGK